MSFLPVLSNARLHGSCRVTSVDFIVYRCVCRIRNMYSTSSIHKPNRLSVEKVGRIHHNMYPGVLLAVIHDTGSAHRIRRSTKLQLFFHHRSRGISGRYKAPLTPASSQCISVTSCCMVVAAPVSFGYAPNYTLFLKNRKLKINKSHQPRIRTGVQRGSP